MSSPDTQPAADRQIRVELLPAAADIVLTTLTPGVDNLRYDVSLSPRFLEQARRYLSDLIRHTGQLGRFYGTDTKAVRAPETSQFRKLLSDFMQAGLNQAHFEKNVELDILLRLAVIRFFTREIAAQFAAVVQECNDWIKRRGEFFERSEGAQVKKATLAEFQADRKNIFRQVGIQLYNALCELEDSVLSKARRALFGDSYAPVYDLLTNRLLFVEGGRDDLVLLENYVLLGNFARDADRYEVFEDVLRDFLRDSVLIGDHGDAVRQAWRQFDEMARRGIEAQAQAAQLIDEREAIDRKLAGEQGLFERLLGSQDPQVLRHSRTDVESRLASLQREMESLGQSLDEAKLKAEALAETYHARLGEFLDHPDNARRLFDAASCTPEDATGSAAREWLLDQWTDRLEHRDLLIHVLSAYELRAICSQFCPPLHLQQLKKAIVLKEEQRRVEETLKHFPTRQFPLAKLEEASRRIRRLSREELRAVALRFASDYMRLRHDLHCAAKVNALLEKISLVENDRTRELSHLNNSLYEFLLPDESRRSEERVISHVVIKADVRNSTQITHDLLERGLNPASHFSLNLYEPMKKLLDRYGAARVFIEGDAIILAIYETITTQMSQRAVAKASSLAREMVGISEAYNARPDNSSMPRLELGIGIAYQDSAPTMWMDGDFRIMISRALNLSDRLSSCSKMARRLVEKNQSPFRVFLLQTLIEGTAEEEAQELLIRYNVGGILLNEDGFIKLTQEISLTRVEATFPFPWGDEEVQLFYGEVPVGSGLEKLVVRKGQVRHLLPEGGFGGPSHISYYEVCANVRVIELAEALVRSAQASSVGAAQLAPGP